jgi:hypothetical protein
MLIINNNQSEVCLWHMILFVLSSGIKIKVVE